MSLKGRIRPDHMPMNKFGLTVVGLLPTNNITFISVSGLETEVAGVDLPDRTRATGGQAGPSTATVAVPTHHEDEVTAMELWLREGQDPVTPTYKKIATLTQFSNTGAITRTWSLMGVWITKRKLADLAFDNDGEMSTNEYELSVDEVIPLGLPL